MKLVISIVNKVHVWKTWHVGMIQGWLKVDFVWCDANLRLVILTTLPINLSKTKANKWFIVSQIVLSGPLSDSVLGEPEKKKKESIHYPVCQSARWVMLIQKIYPCVVKQWPQLTPQPYHCTALADLLYPPCLRFVPLAPEKVLQSKQEIWLSGFGAPWGKDLSNIKLIWRWCVHQCWWGSSPSAELMQEDSTMSWREGKMEKLVLLSHVVCVCVRSTGAPNDTAR